MRKNWNDLLNDNEIVNIVSLPLGGGGGGFCDGNFLRRETRLVGQLLDGGLPAQKGC